LNLRKKTRLSALSGCMGVWYQS